MSNEALKEQMTARVSEVVKGAFRQLADERHLDTSDLHREALREYLEKRGVGLKPLAEPKEQVAA